jgi:membrane-associated protease RseP (regulator of RpoE activity)
MLALALAFLLSVAVHLSGFVVAARLAGVAVTEVSFGFGPTLLHVSKLRLRAILWGGYVSFLHSGEDDLPDERMGETFDGRSRTTRALITLSGCIALIGLAVLALGYGGLEALASGFVQFTVGAALPFGRAQEYLGRGLTFSDTAPFYQVWGLVAAKVAAMNLIPLPLTNGGRVIQTVAAGTPLSERWPDGATARFYLAWMVAFFSWCVAVGYFAWHSI